MFHVWDITVPAGTTETEPYDKKLEITAGIIKRIDIKFPAGCHGLVKARLFRWSFQLVPLTSGEWVTGDDESIPTETYYEVTKSPFFLKFKGASPTCTYDHTITVRIEVEPVVLSSDKQIIEKLSEIAEAVKP